MQPPSQQSTPHDASFGLGILSGFIFGLNRTVQVFSRRPGSCGRWFFGSVFWVGWVCYVFYYQLNVDASQRFDAIPEWVVVDLPVAWLAVHYLSELICWFRGQRLHSYHPGIGILNSMMPTWRLSTANFVSDATTSAVMGSIFHVLDCPILASWYWSMIVWLVFGRAFQLAHESILTQRIFDARVEADDWSYRVQEQEHWMAMQKERWGERY